MRIENISILPMEGPDFPLGFIRILDGKIAAVGPMDRLPPLPPGEERLSLPGLTAYPGFIDAHCHMGILEEGLDFEGDDCNEATDPVTPHLRGLDAINPLNQSFEEAVRAGITTVVTGPGSANPIGGQFCAIKTFGRRVDSMVLREPVAMKFALGENPKGCYHDRDEQPVTRMATAALIREALRKAQRYREDWENAKADEDTDPPEYDAKWEALVPVLEGRLKAHFHCHRADDIFTAIRIAEEFSLDYVLIHCTEGHLIAPELAQAGAKAICGPYLCTRSKPELKNLTTRAPGILSKAGIPIAICTDYSELPIDCLALSAALAVRDGLDRRAALEAITISPAKICGLEDRVGSIAPGKDADLLLFSGDPLDVMVRPEYVWINGKCVVNPQTL